MKISIDNFTGMAPKLAPTMLPNSAAQIASNVKLLSGALASVNTPSLESSNIIAAALSVYMLGAVGAQVPLSWTTDVDVAASPLADTEYRIYYTGDGVPKKSSTALAGAPSGGPTAWYNLGVPAPTAAPTTATSGAGSIPAGTYTYVYTHVTQFGATLLEESAPCPASAAVTVSGAQGVLISSIANPPSLTNYNYVYKRIYRTTGTAFQLVAQIATATTSYTDTLSATGIPGDALATAAWIPPPTDLKGICALPSSVLVGFRNNEIWFSEPGYPHAWPTKYMQSLDTQIVGIKAFGNNVVAATQSYPYLGSGLHPDSFTFQKLPMLEPCLSKRSIAGDEFGVLYASSNGLVAVGNEGTGMVSAKAIARDQFTQYAPDTFTAVVFERRYYGFYGSVTYGYGAFVFSRDDPAPVSTLSLIATAALIDATSARMLFVNSTDGKLYRFDPPDTLPYLYTWKSKLFQFPAPTNLGCFRVTGQEDSFADSAYAVTLAAANAVIAAANAAAFAVSDALGSIHSALNGAELNAASVFALDGSALLPSIPVAAQTVVVTVWQGKLEILTGTYALNTVNRLPSGKRALGYEIQITAQREVRGIQLAHSPRELMDA